MLILGNMKKRQHLACDYWQFIVFESFFFLITYNLGKTDTVFFQSCGDILVFLFEMFQGKSAILVVIFSFS